MKGLVIGVDGSDGASVALRWAVAEAELRGWPVTALLVWGFLDQHHVDPEAPFDSNYTSRDAVAALDAYVEDAVGAERAAGVHRVAACDLPASGADRRRRRRLAAWFSGPAESGGSRGSCSAR